MLDPIERAERLKHPTIYPGQTWTPTKPGTGTRCVVEGNRNEVLYRLRSGYQRRQWTWQFADWCRRFACTASGGEAG